MRIVDTKGQRCPKPLIETKKALRESLAGETFQVVTDNKTSFTNISRFLDDHKIRFTVTERVEIWTFQITNETGNAISTPEANLLHKEPPDSPGAGLAVAVSSEFMGQGDDNLGRQLMSSFFVSLSCLDVMPVVIAFYNSGVRLALKDSPVLDTLIELEKKGTEILLCSTCVDHYKIGERIGVGKIGDMYDITHKLSAAGNVLKP
jgi:selenium metabolism protein YedF